MRLGFTDTLSAALVHADERARQLGQEFVGTEHLLLGIIAGQTGEAFRALQAETDIDGLPEELTRQLPKPGKPPMVTGRLPLSPKAQRAINTAVSEAQSAGQAKVSTRFVVLALLGEGDSAVSQALSDSGADLDELRGLLSRESEAGED